MHDPDNLTIEARRLIGATVIRDRDSARFTLGRPATPIHGELKGRLFFQIFPEQPTGSELPEFAEWDLISKHFTIVALRPIDSDLNL